MNLWLWSLNYLQNAIDPEGGKLYHGQRQGVTFALADALSWLLASRAQILDVLELEARGADGCGGRRRPCRDRAVPQRPLPHPGRAGGGRGLAHLRRAGLRLQPPSRWDEEEHRHCFLAAELEELEETMAGIARHGHGCAGRRRQRIRRRPAPARAAPARESFCACKTSSTMCLTGSRLAKDRAAETVSKVMNP